MHSKKEIYWNSYKEKLPYRFVKFNVGGSHLKHKHWYRSVTDDKNVKKYKIKKTINTYRFVQCIKY